MDSEARWQRNESELNRIARMSGLDRELHAERAESLEAGQDEIEYELGFDNPADPGSRRWSDMIQKENRRPSRAGESGGFRVGRWPI
jgi:hypothetical protein